MNTSNKSRGVAVNFHVPSNIIILIKLIYSNHSHFFPITRLNIRQKYPVGCSGYNWFCIDLKHWAKGINSSILNVTWRLWNSHQDMSAILFWEKQEEIGGVQRLQCKGFFPIVWAICLLLPNNFSTVMLAPKWAFSWWRCCCTGFL